MLFSQSGADSLYRYSLETENDSIRLRALEQLISEKVYQDTELAERYMQEALRISAGLEDDLKARAYNLKGIVYDVKGQYDSALVAYQKSVDLSPPIEASGFLGEPLNNMGLVYWNQGIYDKAIRYFFNSLEVFERHNLVRGVAHNYNNIALVYQDMDKLKQALSFHKKAYAIRLKIGDEWGIGASLSNIGNVYDQLNRKDSASFYYQLALEQKRQLDDVLGLAIAYNNLGVTYMELGKYADAKSYLQRAVRLTQETNATNQLAQNYTLLGRIAIREKALALAESYLDSAEQLLGQLESPLRESEYVYARIQLDSARGNWENLARLWPRYFRLEQEIKNLKTEEIVSGIEARYNLAEKEKTLAQNEVKMAADQLELQRRSIGIMVLAFVLIAAVLIAFFIIRQAKLKEMKLQAEASLKEERAQSELRLKLQEERERIGRDLHDHVGAHLTVVTGALESMAKREDSAEKRAQFHRVGQQTRETIGHLRESIWAMNSEQISLAAVVSKLREYTHRIELEEGQQIEVQLSGNGDALLGPVKTVGLFRICQEAISNAIKHASFTQMQLHFNCADEELNLCISNNGEAREEEKSGLGYGLENMQYRASEMGGQLHIQKDRESGWRIHLKLKHA